MIYKRLLVDLAHNSRTQAGLESGINDFEVDGYGTLLNAQTNDVLGYSVYISRADLGRWDSEGTKYLTELLACVEGDIISVEEDWLTDEEKTAVLNGEVEVAS